MKHTNCQCGHPDWAPQHHAVECPTFPSHMREMQRYANYRHSLGTLAKLNAITWEAWQRGERP